MPLVAGQHVLDVPHAVVEGVVEHHAGVSGNAEHGGHPAANQGVDEDVGAAPRRRNGRWARRLRGSGGGGHGAAFLWDFQAVLGKQVVPGKAGQERRGVGQQAVVEASTG